MVESMVIGFIYSVTLGVTILYNAPTILNEMEEYDLEPITSNYEFDN
tara:strand:- start:4194 stop:4334 length:141 start_codon:yes stop_codon:yes gene_type:complete